jgi:hypothetical protein
MKTKSSPKTMTIREFVKAVRQRQKSGAKWFELKATVCGLEVSLKAWGYWPKSYKVDGMEYALGYMLSPRAFRQMIY